jgi:hypothetical protein
MFQPCVNIKTPPHSCSHCGWWWNPICCFLPCFCRWPEPATKLPTYKEPLDLPMPRIHAEEMVVGGADATVTHEFVADMRKQPSA